LPEQEQEQEWIVPESKFGSRFGLDEVEAVIRSWQSEGLSLVRDGELDHFAEEFKEHCGCQYAFPVSTACNALALTAELIGLAPGDEVITNPITYIGTSAYALRAGATIRFADVDPRSLLADEDEIEKLVNEHTKAIYLASYDGQLNDMDRVVEIAREHGLVFVFDAARCPGAEFKGRKVGSMADMTCFSFHSQKNMTTGEGGMLTLNGPRADEFAPTASAMRNVWGTAERIAENYRMDEMRAAIGREQLKKLDSFNDERRELAHHLTKCLEGVPHITTAFEYPERKHAFHWYMAKVDSRALGIERDEFIRMLKEDEGIACSAGNRPSYLEKMYEMRGYQPGQCPIAEEEYTYHALRLPIHLRLTLNHMDMVADAVRRTVERLASEGAAKW